MYINYFQCTKALNLVDIHEFFYTPRKEKKEKKGFGWKPKTWIDTFGKTLFDDDDNESK